MNRNIYKSLLPALMVLFFVRIAEADPTDGRYIGLILDDSSSMLRNDRAHLAPLTVHLISQLARSKDVLVLQRMVALSQSGSQPIVEGKGAVQRTAKTWCPKEGRTDHTEFVSAFQALRDHVSHQPFDLSERVVLSLTDGEYTTEAWQDYIFPYAEKFISNTDIGMNIVHLSTPISATLEGRAQAAGLGYAKIRVHPEAIGQPNECSLFDTESLEAYFSGVFDGFLGAKAHFIKNPRIVRFHPYAERAFLIAVGVNQVPNLSLKSSTEMTTPTSYVQRLNCPLGVVFNPKPPPFCDSGYALLAMGRPGTKSYAFDISNYDVLFALGEIPLELDAELPSRAERGSFPLIRARLFDVRDAKLKVKDDAFLKTVRMTVAETRTGPSIMTLSYAGNGEFEGRLKVRTTGASVLSRAGPKEVFVRAVDRSLSFVQGVQTEVYIPRASLHVQVDRRCVARDSVPVEFKLHIGYAKTWPSNLSFEVETPSGKSQNQSAAHQGGGIYTAVLVPEEVGVHTIRAHAMFETQHVQTEAQFDVLPYLELEIAPIELGRVVAGSTIAAALLGKVKESTGQHTLRVSLVDVPSELEIEGKFEGVWQPLENIELRIDQVKHFAIELRARLSLCTDLSHSDGWRPLAETNTGVNDEAEGRRHGDYDILRVGEIYRFNHGAFYFRLMMN